MKNTVSRYVGRLTVWAVFAITLVVVIMNDDSALPSTAWPNEPIGFNLITDWPWNSLTGSGWHDEFEVDDRITSDSTAPLSPPNVLQDHCDPSNTFGGGGKHWYGLSPIAGGTGQPLTEGYAGVWWKVSNPFVPYASGFEKGFKFDDNGGAMWVQLNGSSSDQLYIIVSLSFNTPVLDNCNLPNSWGDCPGNRQIGATGPAHFTPGVWHKVELYFKFSSCSTCFNGIIRVWLDGTMTHNLTTVNFPPLSDGMWDFVITPAWSGSISCPTAKSHFWDHVHLSSPTGGGTSGDSTPPVAPTGLRVQ